MTIFQTQLTHEMPRKLTLFLVCAFEIALILFVAAASANAGLFDANTYEDCVLENMEKAKTEQALASVESICRSKHPITSTPTSEKFNAGKLICEYKSSNTKPWKSPLVTLLVDRKNEIFKFNKEGIELVAETEEKIFFNGYKTENAQVRMTLKKSSPFALEFSVTVEPDNKKHYWNFECSPERK